MVAPANAGGPSAQTRSLATPAVRAIAKANNLDISTVQGSGKSGRVMKEDILRVLGGKRFDNVTLDPPASASESAAKLAKHQNGVSKTAGMTNGMSHVAPPSPHAALAAPQPASVSTGVSEADTRVPVRGYMRAMIKTMQAQTAVPHLVFSDEYAMDELIALRRRCQAQQGEGARLTYMPFLVKALSLALSEFPEMNATFSDDQEFVIQRAAHNVGIAVDSPNGLVVPNIKNVERLSIVQIAGELARLSELARANKLAQADLTGGTITLSNIGAIGGTYMSPILVPGEAAIGAMGAMQKVPKYAADGSLQPHMVMKMSWAADHRLLAGATVARFSNRFKALIQDPALMLVALR